MYWPYHFVGLDENQQLRRRQLLDSYGQFAQLSVLLLPLAYQLYHGFRLIGGRAFQSEKTALNKGRGSPVVSGHRKSLTTRNWHVSSRLYWILDDEIFAGWGSLRHWLFVVGWSMWLLLLVVRDTGDDYLHVTKRFGIVAASQLPMHYLLALKSWSPVQYVTRMSHEELNPYHRSLGRIIILFFACHASLYLNFYVQMGLLMKRIQDRDVILGLCAVTSAGVLFTSAVARVRDYSYRLFFYLHVTLSVVLLPILYFHVIHLRVYILEAAAVYTLLILQRNMAQSSHQGVISRLQDTKLLSISVALTDHLAKQLYCPGQHIYLAFPQLTEKLRLNPFTIANLPKEDGKIQLYIRPLNGTTAMLEQLSYQSQPISLSIEGPYGSAKYFPEISSFDSVLLVAGGVGATFTVPFYRRLLHLQENGSWTGALRFLWTVKFAAEASWGLEMLEDLDLSNSLELYETHRSCQDGVRGAGKQMAGADGIELQERSRLLEGDEDQGSAIDGLKGCTVRNGRPNFGKSVDQVFTQDRAGRIAVLVCGPAGMANNLRTEIGRWVAQGRDVFWHNEEFGW